MITRKGLFDQDLFRDSVAGKNIKKVTRAARVDRPRREAMKTSGRRRLQVIWYYHTNN